MCWLYLMFRLEVGGWRKSCPVFECSGKGTGFTEPAGVFVLWAVTDLRMPLGKGTSCFLVEKDTHGLSISKAEKKMGQHASCTNEVVFDACRIPKDALMGELNQGFKIAVGELAGGRIGVGSLALGIGQAAILCTLLPQHLTMRQQ